MIDEKKVIQEILKIQKENSFFHNEKAIIQNGIFKFSIFEDVCCGQGIDIDTEAVEQFLEKYSTHLFEIGLKEDSKKIKSIISTVSNAAKNEDLTVSEMLEKVKSIQKTIDYNKKEIEKLIYRLGLVKFSVSFKKLSDKETEALTATLDELNIKYKNYYGYSYKFLADKHILDAIINLYNEKTESKYNNIKGRFNISESLDPDPDLLKLYL